MILTANTMYTNGTTTISGKRIIIDGCVVLNPTEQQLAEQGWEKVVPTPEEVAERERLQRIDELKMLLADSDYKAIKYAEGWLSAEEYAPIKAQRQAWRDEINEIENVDTN